MVTDREIIRRILTHFTNGTPRDIARIGGFENVGRLQEVLTRMVSEGDLIRVQEPVEEGDGKDSRMWRYSLAPAGTQQRLLRAKIYQPSPERAAEGRSLWTTAAVVVFALLCGTAAQAQTEPLITDPSTADIVFVNVDLRVTSFLCKVGPSNTQTGAWDAVPSFACGNLATPDAAQTEHTWPLPDLPDGKYLVAVNACAPGALGCSGYTEAMPFTVSRSGTPPPPPPPPPPPGVQKPITVTVRQRTKSAAAAPSARPSIAATAATAATTVTTKPDVPSVVVSVPFSELGRTRICLHFSDGSPACHNADWWLGLIPPAKRP